MLSTMSSRGGSSSRSRKRKRGGGRNRTLAVTGFALVAALGVGAVVALVNIQSDRSAALQAELDAYVPYVAPAEDEPTCVAGAPQLARTAALLETDPGAVRIALVGDSTRDENVGAAALYSAMRAGLPTVDPANIINFGRNGFSLDRYAADSALQADLVDISPTLIEVSIGINDLREGEGTAAGFQGELEQYIEGLHAALPDTDILLSIPAALSTVNVAERNYLTGADGTINSAGAADVVTQSLRSAYLTTADNLDYVALNDVQTLVTGLAADTSPQPKFLADQLHPTAETYSAIAGLIVSAVAGHCD
jgi:lysophospholipase L1-like esterase